MSNLYPDPEKFTRFAQALAGQLVRTEFEKEETEKIEADSIFP